MTKLAELKPYDTSTTEHQHYSQHYSTSHSTDTECDRCHKPIVGTALYMRGGSEPKTMHVGCTSIQELQARRACNMRPLTKAEAQRMAGIKPAPECPKEGKAPATWVKALGEAVKAPRFTLDGMAPEYATDPRQIAVANAIAKQATMGNVAEVAPNAKPAPKRARKAKAKPAPKATETPAETFGKSSVQSVAAPTPATVHRGGVWTCGHCSNTFYIPEGSPESFADFGAEHGRSCVNADDIREAMFAGQRQAVSA